MVASGNSSLTAASPRAYHILSKTQSCFSTEELRQYHI